MPSIPNFFIVGAPKCGTTALHRYLSPHPNIFLSRLKEPHYFAKDLGTYPAAKTLEQYLALFEERTPAHTRVGEASVYYLRSRVAIGNIREFNPDARLIAMLRNPVEMVYSLHSQLLYWGEESEPDFETAWRLQERRAAGHDIPPRSREPSLVQYEHIGRLGSQTERMLSIFPREQVRLILYDDFAADPQRVYDDVLRFLGVPHDGRTEFPKVNDNKRARLGWLGWFIRKPPPALRRSYRKLKRSVGGSGLDAVKREVVSRNTVKEKRSPLSAEFREELVEAFRGEVDLLSRILDRDLSHWR
ncbi:MAG TPA: sulfotransferase [Gemmatimonadales bacterium]|nr:sulfotransferase [Gemmatimonadales bacterium]